MSSPDPADSLPKCAISAQGPWVAHLRRAQRIIEALGVLRIQKTPKIQAQVDMLVWCVIALYSIDFARPES